MNATVLVVEDDDILRYLAGEALSILDLEVIGCASADHALQMLNEPRHFNLVLTDIRMPGTLDGLELAKMIWTRWPDLPVILTSGHAHLMADQLPAGAAFMAKPWTIDQLHDAVQQLLPVAS